MEASVQAHVRGNLTLGSWLQSSHGAATVCVFGGILTLLLGALLPQTWQQIAAMLVGTLIAATGAVLPWRATTLPDAVSPLTSTEISADGTVRVSGHQLTASQHVSVIRSVLKTRAPAPVPYGSLVELSDGSLTTQAYSPEQQEQVADENTRKLTAFDNELVQKLTTQQ